MASITTGVEYRLRAGSPMPVSTKGNFVLHSVMALLSNVYIDQCAASLPQSTDFRGQGGDYMSASFSRLSLSEERFKGKINDSGRYVDETTGGFN